jgi:hypothetical protein
MQGLTLPTCVMSGLAVRSWSGRRCGVPICGARIFAWQSSTAQIWPGRFFIPAQRGFILLVSGLE